MLRSAALVATAALLLAGSALGQQQCTPTCGRVSGGAAGSNTDSTVCRFIDGRCPQAQCYTSEGRILHSDGTVRPECDTAGCPIVNNGGCSTTDECVLDAALSRDSPRAVYTCQPRSTNNNTTPPGCSQCLIDVCQAATTLPNFDATCAQRLSRQTLRCDPDPCGVLPCRPRFIDVVTGALVDCFTDQQCTPAECGPVPTRTNRTRPCASDPSVNGDFFETVCTRQADGSCGYRYHACPPTRPGTCDIQRTIAGCAAAVSSCPNGVERDPTTECPTCTCAPDNTCDTRTCPQVQCDRDQVLVRTPGQCCPSRCVDRPSDRPAICANANCPRIQCTGTEVEIRRPGTCCPVCYDRNRTNACPNGRCLADRATCPPNFRKVERGCCATCVPIKPCDRVVCRAQVTDSTAPGFCNPRTHRLRRVDGECCPVCERKPPVDQCAGVRCPRPTCPTGFTLRRRRGDCCGRCVPDDNCEAVACPRDPAATYLVDREGDCCPTPIYCRAVRNPATGEAREVCSLDDLTECATGTTERNPSTGDCDPVPATRRVERIIDVDADQRSDGSCEPDEDLRHRILTRIRNIDSRTVDVQRIPAEDANGKCRIRIRIRFVRPNAGAPETPDSYGRTIDEVRDSVRADVAADPALNEVPQGSNPPSSEVESSATALAGSATLAVGVAAVMA